MSSRRRKLSGREEAEVERLLEKTDMALAHLNAQMDRAIVVLREYNEFMRAAVRADRTKAQ